MRSLAWALPEEYRLEVQAAAREIGDPAVRCSTLAGIAPHLPESAQFDAVREALALLDQVPDSWKRLSVLEDIAGGLPDALREEALATARLVLEGRERARALCELTVAMPEAARPALYEEAVAIVRQVDDGWMRAEGMADLSGYLPAPFSAALARDAWETLRGLDREQSEQHEVGERVALLSELVRRLPEDTVGETAAEAVGILKAMPESDTRQRLARMMEDVIGERQRSEVRSRSRAATWRKSEGPTARELSARAAVLLRQMRGLPAEARSAAVPEALAAIRLSDYDQGYPLRQLIRCLPDGLSDEVIILILAAIRSINMPDARARLLEDLAGHLAGAQQTEVLCEALTADYDRTGAKLMDRLAAQWKARGMTAVTPGSTCCSVRCPNLPACGGVT